MKPTKSKRKKPLPMYVSLEEFTEILRHTKSIHHKVAFLLAFQSGLRISECLNLQHRDIDLQNRTIRINEGKGGKDRYARLPVSWNEGLMEYIPIPCTARSLQTAFILAATKSGLKEKKPKIHFHSLRHGYATFLAEQGTDIRLIQMLLGHEDIQTTMIYTHLAPKKSFEAHDKAFGVN